MYGIEVPGELSGLFTTGYGISRLLIAMGLIVAAVLFVQRKTRLATALSIAILVMGFVQWDLHRVTVALPQLATIHGGYGDTNPLNDYMVVMTPEPLPPTLMLAVALLVFVVACAVCAFRARKTLTGGVGIIAVTVLLLVNAELLRAYGSIDSSYRDVMEYVCITFWAIVVNVTAIYVVVALVVIYRRALAKEPPKKSTSTH